MTRIREEEDTVLPFLQSYILLSNSYSYSSILLVFVLTGMFIKKYNIEPFHMLAGLAGKFLMSYNRLFGLLLA